MTQQLSEAEKAAAYQQFVKDDPYRHQLQYPAVLDALGDVAGKRILDIGCGEGTFARMLSERGASVFGYDEKKEVIALAQKAEDERPLGIQYQFATQHEFRGTASSFDAATSVMVLSYAKSGDDLRAFFRSAARHLVKNGLFVSAVPNPHFTAYDTLLVGRRWIKNADGTVTVKFYNNNGAKIFSATANKFSQEQYEICRERERLWHFKRRPVAENVRRD